MSFAIEELSVDDAAVVLDWIRRLLDELGEEGEEAGSLDVPRILEGWRSRRELFRVLAARDDSGEIAGLLTLSENFAIYANGNYGVIDEMIVAPRFRSRGIGALLVAAAVEIGRERGWRRIDVTAPESERWARTRAFYERHGFVFTGPKLRLSLA